MKLSLTIILWLVIYGTAISQSLFAEIETLPSFLSEEYFHTVAPGQESDFKNFDSYFMSSFSNKVDFMAVPQWFNLGFGTGGFYISYLNTHVKALFKPLTEPGNSSGIYLGLYNTARLRDQDDLSGDFGVRGTYFLKNLEDKFNIYGKVELAILNLEDDELNYLLPRIGAGVRWRFLYLEVGTGPNPLHAGLCWQWSTRKSRQNK